MSGHTHMPFTNRTAWHTSQQECPDLRRVHAHLAQGTCPGRKANKVRDVCRYLHDVIIANDGLLVVRDNKPFQPHYNHSQLLTRQILLVPHLLLTL